MLIPFGIDIFYQFRMYTCNKQVISQLATGCYSKILAFRIDGVWFALKYKSMNLKSLFLLTLSLVLGQNLSGQEALSFLYTEGENNVSTITIGSTHCTVFEYPEFLVVNEIPNMPFSDNELDNPLISFIDSIYQNKPIKYVLNSHSHSHSLSTIIPFLDRGAKLVTAVENIEIFDKRGLFGEQKSAWYSDMIISIASDTTLLSGTDNPIQVLHLKKSEYKHIPTASYLFFNFPKHKLLATSCMVYLKDLHENHGFGGTIYSGRITDVNDLIADRGLKVESTMQLYNFRYEDEKRKLPVFSLSFLQNVIKHGWSRKELAEHLQNMTYEELTTKKDSVLNFIIENGIYTVVLNSAIYSLIEKKEYKKAVALAHLQVIYRPDSANLIDTLGEAYYNNGQKDMAKHYDGVLKRLGKNTEGLGIVEWEINQKKRLESGS